MSEFTFSLKGLKKVEGRSFEEITELFTEHSIGHDVLVPPQTLNGYFRTSTIHVPLRDHGKVIRILGNSHKHRVSTLYFYALYEMKNFELDDYTGSLQYKDGKLAERIRIYGRMLR